LQHYYFFDANIFLQKGREFMNLINNIETQNLWLEEMDGDFGTFVTQVTTQTNPRSVPLASQIEKQIPIYSGEVVRAASDQPSHRKALLTEWTKVFLSGAGIIVIRNGIENAAVVDRASEVFSQIIESEKTETLGGGDHFAQAGANDRIWNALEKHCLIDPHNFTEYYASDAIAMGAEAWLGRGYQVTAQVNCVKPSGKAQKPHRDYHLGFMSPTQTLDYPTHVHAMSPFLTLQGAVAHCDMPLESGPTKLLPFSQKFLEGYLVFEQEQYRDYFEANHIQLTLEKGDVLFFNPAVMHAAGDNVSADIYRMANLLQISSAFGRAMEAVNRSKMSKALFPVLKDFSNGKILIDRQLNNAIHACAEGYSFPTNLDLDPPIGGLAPKSQSQIIKEALEQNLSTAQFTEILDQLHARQQS
jgi:ectoine hydroxylase-related dioxygenase (phytanoyl-CoA dioxygenase family)